MKRLMIIGQGLMGSLLAMEALKRDYSVLVVDQGNTQSASAKAAGLMTPIRGKRLTKLWATSEKLHAVITHYQELELRLGCSFLKPRTLIKRIHDTETLAYYHQRRKDPAYHEVLGDEIESSDIPELAKAALTLRIEPVYQLLTSPFLRAVRTFLKENHLLIEKSFFHSDLQINSSEKKGVRWENFESDDVVFCEGHLGRFNPFFHDLDWQCAKGDLVELDVEGLPKDSVFNQGTWLAPLEGSHYRFGTNAIWQFENEQTDPNTVAPLLKELERLLKVPYTLTGLQSGVRASFKNRVPQQMTHPVYPSLHLMNGLGGQGTFWGPLLAQDFFQNRS